MKTFDSRRHLRIETLEPRAMLSGNSARNGNLLNPYYHSASDYYLNSA